MDWKELIRTAPELIRAGGATRLSLAVFFLGLCAIVTLTMTRRASVGWRFSALLLLLVTSLTIFFGVLLLSPNDSLDHSEVAKVTISTPNIPVFDRGANPAPLSDPSADTAQAETLPTSGSQERIWAFSPQAASGRNLLVELAGPNLDGQTWNRIISYLHASPQSPDHPSTHVLELIDAVPTAGRYGSCPNAIVFKIHYRLRAVRGGAPASLAEPRLSVGSDCLNFSNDRESSILKAIAAAAVDLQSQIGAQL